MWWWWGLTRGHLFLYLLLTHYLSPLPSLPSLQSDTPVVEACVQAMFNVTNPKCAPDGQYGGKYGYVDPDWCQGPGMEDKMEDIFEWLYFVDEYLGHYMWFGGEMLCMCTFFWGCFTPGRPELTTRENWKLSSAPISWRKFWALFLLPALYFPYLFIEGQAWPEYFFFLCCGTYRVAAMHRKGYVPDSNGIYMIFWWVTSCSVFIIFCIHLRVPIQCLVKLKIQNVPEIYESGGILGIGNPGYPTRTSRFFTSAPNGDPYAACF